MNKYFKRSTKILVVILLLLLGHSGWAQYNGTKAYQLPELSDGSPLEPIEIPKPPQDIRKKVDKANIRLTLNTGEIHRLGGHTFNVDIRVQISGYKQDGSNIFVSEYIDLEISTGKPEHLFIYNIAPHLNNLHSVSLVVNSFNLTASDPVIDHLRNDLTLSAEYQIDYHYDIMYENNQMVIPLISSLSGSPLQSRVQTFKWETGNIIFPGHELELLRLYNINENKVTNPEAIDVEIDWSKALKIETQNIQNELTISIAEGSGFYVWRVRPVGNYYKGGVGDSRNWGNWSAAPAQNEKIENLNLSYLAANPSFLYLDDPDEDINWIYSRTFTENDRISENIAYANGLQQVRQTQTHLQSQDKSLITQSVVDFTGRPALVTMPAPVDGGLNGFKRGVIKSEGSIYTADQFDSDKNFESPDPIDQGGAFDYYSDLNADLNIPNAEGYPYSRTVFMNDGTGRVQEQSGVGKIHAIGEQVKGKGRTVRTFYSNPSEEELIRIFGDEAPSASATLKTTTIDANNTTSVTYTTKEGKVIATSLSVHDDDNLLEDVSNSQQDFNVSTSVTENTPVPFGFVSSKRVSFSKPTQVNIGYEIPCEIREMGCFKLDVDCGYQAQFFIHDLSTGDIYESGVKELTKTLYPCSAGGKISISNVSDWSPEIPNNELKPGAYIIKKILISTADKDDQVRVSVNQSANNIEPLVGVFKGWLANVSSENDFKEFYKSVQDFQNLLDAAIDKVQDWNDPDQSLFDEVRNYISPLGMVELEGFNFTEDHEVKLDNPYDPNNYSEETRPKLLFISGDCCGTITVPLTYMPPIECFTAEEMRNDTEKRPDFWGYVNNALIIPYGEYMDKTMEDVLPGYTQESLNAMIYYMLTDRYYAGPTIVDQFGNRVKADGSPITEEDKKEQYECQALWDCWIGIVNSYQDMLNQEYGDLETVDKGIKDEDDASGDSNTKDNHFNTEGEKMKGGFIMRWLVKRAIAKRVKDGEGLGSPFQRPQPIEFEFTIIDQFLNCTGYRLAAIVEDDSYYEVLPEDLVGAGGKDIYYNSEGYHINQQKPLLPYIKNMVFAFKYIQYDGESFTPRYKGLEIGLCYDDYSTVDPPPCNNPCGDRDRLDWSADERYNFYQTLISYRAPEPPDEELTDAETDAKLEAEAERIFNEMKAGCEGDCEKRRLDIRMKVKQAFEDNCYNIGGCPTDLNVILPEDIEEIVNQLIMECERECTQIFVAAKEGPTQYPYIVTETCSILNESGTDFISQTSQVPVILPDCDYLRYDQIRNWGFVFALDDDESICRCYDGFSTVNIESPWKALVKARNDEGEAYTVSDRLIIESTDKDVALYDGIWRDDLTGDFEVSVTIVDHHVEPNAQGKAGIFTANDANDFSKGGLAMVSFENGAFTFSYDISGVVGQISHTESHGNVAFPCKVKLTRSGNIITAAYKTGPQDDPEKGWKEIGSAVTPQQLDINSQVGLFNTGSSKVTMDDFICGQIFPNQELNTDWINKELPNCETYLAIPAAEASILTTPFYSPITRMDVLLGGSNEEKAQDKEEKKEEKAQDKEDKEEDKAEKKEEKAADKEEKKEGKSK